MNLGDALPLALRGLSHRELASARCTCTALREASASALVAEARAFQGIVSSEAQLELDAFVATATTSSQGSSGHGFVKLEVPPRVAPEDARPGVGVELSQEELYDPLLSRCLPPHF